MKLTLALVLILGLAGCTDARRAAGRCDNRAAAIYPEQSVTMPGRAQHFMLACMRSEGFEVDLRQCATDAAPFDSGVCYRRLK